MPVLSGPHPGMPAQRDRHLPSAVHQALKLVVGVLGLLVPAGEPGILPAALQSPGGGASRPGVKGAVEGEEAGRLIFGGAAYGHKRIIQPGVAFPVRQVGEGVGIAFRLQGKLYPQLRPGEPSQGSGGFCPGERGLTVKGAIEVGAGQNPRPVEVQYPLVPGAGDRLHCVDDGKFQPLGRKGQGLKEGIAVGGVGDASVGEKVRAAGLGQINQRVPAPGVHIPLGLIHGKAHGILLGVPFRPIPKALGVGTLGKLCLPVGLQQHPGGHHQSLIAVEGLPGGKTVLTYAVQQPLLYAHGYIGGEPVLGGHIGKSGACLLRQGGKGEGQGQGQQDREQSLFHNKASFWIVSHETLAKIKKWGATVGKLPPKGCQTDFTSWWGPGPWCRPCRATGPRGSSRCRRPEDCSPAGR